MRMNGPRFLYWRHLSTVFCKANDSPTVPTDKVKAIIKAQGEILVPATAAAGMQGLNLSFPWKVTQISFDFFFFFFLPPVGRRRSAQMWFYELLNSNVMNMNEIIQKCLWNFLHSKSAITATENTDHDSPSSPSSSSSAVSAVSAHVGGPHRRRVVIPDERQHYYQRLHWSHTQGLERRDRRMYPHPLRAYLNSALHAPTWEKVWADPTVRRQ